MTTISHGLYLASRDRPIAGKGVIARAVPVESGAGGIANLKGDRTRPRLLDISRTSEPLVGGVASIEESQGTARVDIPGLIRREGDLAQHIGSA